MNMRLKDLIFKDVDHIVELSHKNTDLLVFLLYLGICIDI